MGKKERKENSLPAISALVQARTSSDDRHARAHVTRRRAVITYCKAVTHALYYFQKSDVLWAEQQDGAILQRSSVSQNKPKPMNDGERQKCRWEMIKEMVLLDGGATFLRGCQVSPDFSAYHNNKADEMPHIQCSTGYPPPPSSPADTMTNGHVRAQQPSVV